MRHQHRATMPKPQTVALFLTISATFLVMQFYGIKYLFDILSSQKPLEERPPWEAVKLFLSKCEASGLHIFVIEPSLLRAVREGNFRRVDLWSKEHHDIVTFGVVDPGLDQMHLVMSTMKHENYDFWEKNDPDPRGMSATLKMSYRVIPTHYLLWVPVQGHTPMLIHLVVFYKREEYFWHSSGMDELHTPPYNINRALFIQKAGAFHLFDLKTVYIEGTKIQYPNNSYTFLKDLENSEFIECNYTRAYHFYSKYGVQKNKEFVVFKRKGRQLLQTVKDILDSIGIPFWLSSGTCLGWFRQCDLISHTTDIDIGIFIQSYREELVSLLENAGLVLTHHFGKVSDSLELSFLYGDLKLDIFCFYVNGDYTWNGGTQASTGNKYKYKFPHFSLCWTEFLELWVRIPCPPEPYIHANYGPKWMIPDHGWDWKTSPNNVMENGRWPKEEWNNVIQLYE